METRAERSDVSDAGDEHPAAAGGRTTEPDWVCRNCRFGARGGFCASCGQSQQEWNISTIAWLRRSSSEVFDLDGRFVRTMVLLIRHPGQLTQAWIDGQRTAYVSPLRLYLLSSAVLFGLLALPGAAGSDALTGGIEGFIRGWSEEGPPGRLAEVAGDEAALRRIAGNITENLPRAMFLLLPFGALLLKLFVRRPRQHYVVHLVWTLHVHTVAFLLTAIIVLLNVLRGNAKYVIGYPLLTAAAIWASWYVVGAFSRVFERSFARSAAYLVLLGAVYVPVFLLVVISLSGLGR